MNNKGMTLVEVMVSVMMITVGAMGIAKATAGMTRMLTDGDRTTGSTIEAQARMERIRGTACSNLSSGSHVTPSGYNLAWTISGAGSTRSVELVARYYASAGKTRADTFVTAVSCL